HRASTPGPAGRRGKCPPDPRPHRRPPAPDRAGLRRLPRAGRKGGRLGRRRRREDAFPRKRRSRGDAQTRHLLRPPAVAGRGRRLLILALLFLLPTVLAAIVRFAPHAPPSSHLEFVIVFHFIPHALVPLTALLYSAGLIQDEVEEQTLTYLLLRPIPRWALF